LRKQVISQVDNILYLQDSS